MASDSSDDGPRSATQHEDGPRSAKQREDESLAGSAAQFTTTHWSVVLTAGHASEAGAREALEELCRTYWFPLYAYTRRRGYSVEEAQDLTQEFFARLIEKPWFAEADSRKGRFRNYLLTALNHFLSNEQRRSRAARRGGGQALIPLDATAEARYAQECVSDLTPERVYERRWALSLFDRALRRLRSQYAAAGKASAYELLKKFLYAEPGEGEYAQLGAEMKMNRTAVAAAVHRLRQQYRKLVREAVAQTVDSPEEIEEEMRWLLEAVN